VRDTTCTEFVSSSVRRRLQTQLRGTSPTARLSIASPKAAASGASRSSQMGATSSPSGKSAVQTWVVMNDLQIPFHDSDAVDLVIDFAQDLEPHGVILNGDIVDCYSISDYTKNPMSYADLETEKGLAEIVMGHVKRTGAKELYWIGGNHEDRLRRYAWKNAPALAQTGELDFARVFRTKENGFNYLPYGEGVQLGRLYVTHGDLVSKHSAYSAKAMFEKYGTSVLHGHTHRLGVYYKRDARGPHAAYENGCLCKLSPEYAQHPNWQQGFSVVHLQPNGEFNVQQIPILPGPHFYFGAERIG
jgi:predicted phosphodiesterase